MKPYNHAQFSIIVDKIIRNIPEAAGKSYALIIVGGGIHGVMIALSAARRGLKSLLLEKNDFGAGTSFNNLGTNQGGLRYRQDLYPNLYLHYLRESRWYLKNFPQLVKTVPILMPLYNRGLSRKSILRLLLRMDKILSAKHNADLESAYQVPSGKIISRDETLRIFPDVDQNGLKAGALWYDVILPEAQLLLMTLIKKACELGATTLNYCEVNKLLVTDHRATGISAFDTVSSREYEFFAPMVVNAAGPWVRELSGIFDAEYADLFKYSIAWNVLFRREPVSTHTLAVKAKSRKAHTYFVDALNKKLLGGTGHAPRESITDLPIPTEGELEGFIANLNDALPGLHLSRNDVEHVFSGYLPVRKDRTTQLVRKSSILDHTKYGGPAGLYSITGVRYSSARYLAENLINRLFPGLKGLSVTGLDFTDLPYQPFESREFSENPEDAVKKYSDILRKLITDDAVLHLDDLLLRRTNLAHDPELVVRIAPYFTGFFDWDAEQTKLELDRVKKSFHQKELSSVI